MAREKDQFYVWCLHVLCRNPQFPVLSIRLACQDHEHGPLRKGAEAHDEDIDSAAALKRGTLLGRCIQVLAIDALHDDDVMIPTESQVQD